MNDEKNRKEFYNCLLSYPSEEGRKCFEQLRNVNPSFVGINSFAYYDEVGGGSEKSLLLDSYVKNKDGIFGGKTLLYKEYPAEDIKLCDKFSHGKYTLADVPDYFSHLFRHRAPPCKMLAKFVEDNGSYHYSQRETDTRDLKHDCKMGKCHACAILTTRYFDSKEANK